MELFSSFEKTRDIDFICVFAKKNFGKKVLEVGCGGGERTHLFVKAGCNVTAVDLVDKRKTSLVSGHKFVVADGRNLPFKDETFDVVVSFDVLEHIDRERKFLEESSRVLKKGGTLVVGTPNRNRFSHKLRQLVGKKITYPLKIGEDCIHLREYTMDELVRAVVKCRLSTTRKEYVWFGLPGVFGFKKFPAFIRNWVQYLFVFAVKL